MQKDLISEISSPLVSFIITTSNHQKEYLVECINSILQLSLNAKEREIILVDDGSDELVASQIKKLLDNLLYLRLPGLGTPAPALMSRMAPSLSSSRRSMLRISSFSIFSSVAA